MARVLDRQQQGVVLESPVHFVWPLGAREEDRGKEIAPLPELYLRERLYSTLVGVSEKLGLFLNTK